MPKAVRFEEYGGVEVLNVAEVPMPEPGPGQVLVRVKAAGINPGEAKIREGLLQSRWPATFPSGQGSDLAGVVARAGQGVIGFTTGDEVIGYTDNRASQPAACSGPDLRTVPVHVRGEDRGEIRGVHPEHGLHGRTGQAQLVTDDGVAVG